MNAAVFPRIEPLEARIAPAAIYTFLDVDGDSVTIKSSKGNNGDFKTLMEAHRVAQSAGFRINEIDLTDVLPASAGEFANTALTVSVVRGAHGDGRVDLGYIKATGLALASIIAPRASIQSLDCGDTKNAIGTLQIASYGTAAPGYFNNGVLDQLGVLSGNVGSIKIAGDIAYGGIEIMGTSKTTVGSIFIGGSLNGAASAATVHAGELIVTNGTIGSITIGGSIIGGAIAQSGGGEGSGVLTFDVANVSGVLSVRGDILGGTGDFSGVIDGLVFAPSVSIGGSVVGGPGADSGEAKFTFLKSAVVGGSLIGGSGYASGQIIPSGYGKFVLGGSIQGGTNNATGLLLAPTGIAASILVKGSVIGGTTSTAIDIAPSGAIEIGDDPMHPYNAGNITIGGNLVGGHITAGSYNFNGAILVNGNVQSIHIGGSILGVEESRAQILVEGQTPAKAGVSFNAIGSLTVGGSVEYAAIASGHSFGGTASLFNLGKAENPDAGIGSVTIGGDYHTSILAGTNDNNGFGAGRFNAGVNYDTQSIGDAARIARLGPVVIKGAILDDYSAGGESGFEAEQILSITAGGTQIYKHGDGLRFFDPNNFVFAQEIPVT